MSSVGGTLDLLMFLTLCVAILSGFPVVFILTGCAIVFGAAGWAIGALTPELLGALSPRIYGTMTSEVLIAIPLFVFMGIMLERSKIAEELLDAMGRVFGAMPGGLAISVSIVGALLAASTGIVGATVVTMGLMALPSMIRRGYQPAFACGTICAAGTLGQIIPPSTVMVILGEVLSAAYQQAQFAQGKFSIETVSVGELFAGSMIPGLVLVALYIAYQAGFALLQPHKAPAIPAEERTRRPVSASELGRALVPPIILIVAVLGSIIGGVATPTEAASVGAVGATLLASLRMPDMPRWPAYLAAIATVGLVALATQFDMRLGRANAPSGDRIAIMLATPLAIALAIGVFTAFLGIWRRGVLQGVMRATTSITAMIFATLIGATLFALVFRGLGGDEMVHGFLKMMPGGQYGALFAIMGVIFLMGFFLDFVEITIIVIPIVGPIILAMGVDPVWFGVMIAVNLQTSFLTPPFGFSLFYLRGVAPPSIRTLDIYRGIVPFVILQLIGLALVIAFPPLATWLPALLFK